MKSYSQVFSELNRAALIPFFVIGDPDFETSLDIVKAAIDAGADILELGKRPWNLSERSRITRIFPSDY